MAETGGAEPLFSISPSLPLSFFLSCSLPLAKLESSMAEKALRVLANTKLTRMHWGEPPCVPPTTTPAVSAMTGVRMGCSVDSALAPAMAPVPAGTVLCWHGASPGRGRLRLSRPAQHQDSTASCRLAGLCAEPHQHIPCKASPGLDRMGQVNCCHRSR